jgi:hypothetical protein
MRAGMQRQAFWRAWHNAEPEASATVFANPSLTLPARKMRLD